MDEVVEKRSMKFSVWEESRITDPICEIISEGILCGLCFMKALNKDLKMCQQAKQVDFIFRQNFGFAFRVV